MKIVFVCTGNTCRSPMAQTIAESLALKHNLEVEVSSAGVSVFSETGASANAVDAMASLGLDLSGHISKQITLEHIKDSNLVLTMTRQHKNFLLDRLDDTYLEKIYTLAEYVSLPEKDISDPFGQPLDDYKKCANEIHQLLDIIFDNLIVERI